MLEEIKKEISNLTAYSQASKMRINDNRAYICRDRVYEILDKHQEQDNKKKSQILCVGGRRKGVSVSQAKFIAKYINDNHLSECTINVAELPNVYKNAWEELKKQHTKLFEACKTEEEYIILGMTGISAHLEEMEKLEKKHGIGVMKQ